MECSGKGECYEQVSKCIPQFTTKKKDEYVCKKACKLAKCKTYKCKGNFPMGSGKEFCDKCDNDNNWKNSVVGTPKPRKTLNFGRYRGFEIKFVDINYLKYLAGEDVNNQVEKDAFSWILENHPDVVKEAKEILLTKCKMCGLDLFKTRSPEIPESSYHTECWERLIAK